VEIFGFPFDNQKFRTAVVTSNGKLYFLFYLTPVRQILFLGFNPVWNSDPFEINLKVPELALLRFCVKDYDRLSGNDFIGQYTIPVLSVTQGKKMSFAKILS
jgi:hypothetical protein